ncbi:hypothetical protein V7S43_003574 [Phytophthora oleae]|uniref:DDE-1 domain-containing protein n=1 Tax=Phytophthora oleae TaxID=2107226 RepID=A0ABD3G0A1_9STRA
MLRLIVWPMDAGIIASFKRAYRRKQHLWVYEKPKSGAKIDKDVYKVDQLQAMRWSKDNWEDLQNKATIESCYRHTGIIFNGVDERSTSDSNYGSDVAVEDIIIRASQLSP